MELLGMTAWAAVVSILASILATPLFPQSAVATPLFPQSAVATPLFPRSAVATPLFPRSAVATPLVPQERGKDAPVPVFPAAAELVQIDVVVTGEDGLPVRDLRREDFEVLEDGRPQRLTHFAVGTAARPAAAPVRGTAVAGASTSTPPGPAGRTIVLVFDDLHLGASRLAAAKRDATHFIREQVGPRDQVAVVTTSGVRSVFQPLTRDREALVRAVERVSLQDRSARFRFGPPTISEHQAEQIDRFGELASAGNEALELAVTQFMAEFFVDRTAALAMVRERVRNVLDEGAHYTRASLSALEATVRVLAPVPGRKIVVLLSEGLFLGRGTRSEGAYDLRRITDAATRSGAVVYSLDAGGLTVPAPAGDITERFAGDRSIAVRARVESGQDESRREAMKAVADATGGLAVLNSNDIGKGLQRVLDDNEVYYLLAYEPVSPRRAGRFRSIRVRLPGRPDLTARTRRGYFEPRGDLAEAKPASRPPREAKEEAEDRVRDALTSIVPLRGLSVDLAVDFLDLPDAGPTVVVNVAAGPRDPGRMETDGEPRSFEVVGLVSGEDGSSVEPFSGRSDGVAFRRLFALDPGVYQVRVVALGGGPGETGSASQWVEVPDLASGRLVLSSLFLARARREDGPAGGPEAPLLPGAAARRSFPAGSEVDVVLFAYNARGDEAGRPDLAVRIQLRSDGRLVHEFQPRPMRADDPGSTGRRPPVARWPPPRRLRDARRGRRPACGHGRGAIGRVRRGVTARVDRRAARVVRSGGIFPSSPHQEAAFRRL
jgi:VWFA-related protein